MNASALDYRQVVVDTVRQEHRALAQVLECLQHLLRDIASGHGIAEFHLLSLALYYIDDFQVRLHHPKEDEYLFAAIRRQTRDLDHAIAALRSEHRTDRQMLRELYRLLVIYQAGAPEALENLRTSVDVYAEMTYEHMRKEEALFEDARIRMPQAEWRAIAEVFLADEDPLFGAERRREFALLHHRIVNLLPSKMRRRAAVASAVAPVPPR